MRTTIAPSLTPTASLPRLQSNHPFSCSQKGKIKRNSILNISHLHIDKACTDMA
ncbi:hypothetical protein HMPREF3185_00591 [Porphyromonas somerae]|uniref:Uncharacterized protein n=1 Tax=Porphyromonas somerae TaxID=322095 RepID=A0A134BBB2_9PORP|nr:hypothetical protein HMPREF3184_00591 [Porphyromonadaceae bacterium KA00676]KXB77216.1 hypothetical protein HMPREF3185_00591 [Porphyromonas somerae]